MSDKQVNWRYYRTIAAISVSVLLAYGIERWLCSLVNCYYILVTGCAVAQALVLTATQSSFPCEPRATFRPRSNPRVYRPPTDFHATWLKWRGFTQVCAFCSKNRYLSCFTILMPQRSKFCNVFDIEISGLDFWPLALETPIRTPLILHRSPLNMT